MLIWGIVVAAVLAALTVVLLTRRAAHDDLHSVEGYHRSIHTLESINAHPAAPGPAGAAPSLFEKPAYPESAIRLAGTPSVRVTDAPPASVPPVPPPPAVNAEIPVTFDDTDLSTPPTPPTPPMPLHDAPGSRDKALGSINHRPRRLAAPAMAVAVVIVLVVVLLLTGSHKVAPPRHHHAGSTETNVTAPTTPKPQPKPTAQSTTNLPSPVSLPQSSTARTATYNVPGGSFSLSFAATTGQCWVDVTNSSSGATLFAGTLQPGAQQSLNATGPVTVIVGAPTVLAVSVDGSQVALPSGFQTPFTMRFVTAS
jgi:Domain of unknown function (DUF4115)